MLNDQECRVCGCTDYYCGQCIEKTGHPCHWVEEDLCSACAMKTGIELITEERQRQIEKEGWTAEHDAEHVNGELALAAGCYVIPSEKLKFRSPGFFRGNGEFFIPELWPWEDSWYKPSPDNKKENRIRELQKAGALIAAEIDRLNNI